MKNLPANEYYDCFMKLEKNFLLKNNPSFNLFTRKMRQYDCKFKKITFQFSIIPFKYNCKTNLMKQDI